MSSDQVETRDTPVETVTSPVEQIPSTSSGSDSEHPTRKNHRRQNRAPKNRSQNNETVQIKKNVLDNILRVLEETEKSINTQINSSKEHIRTLLEQKKEVSKSIKMVKNSANPRQHNPNRQPRIRKPRAPRKVESGSEENTEEVKQITDDVDQTNKHVVVSVPEVVVVAE